MPPDSTPSPPVPAVPEDGLLRLGRVLPLVEAASRVAYRWAAAGALGAAAVGTAVADASALVTWAGGAALAAVLAVPAAASALAGWTLADVASLPGEIRAAARTAVAPQPGRGLGRVLRTVWAARELVVSARGGWLRALGAVRLVRLASLPFALALVGLAALNGAVVVAGLVAVAVLLI